MLNKLQNQQGFDKNKFYRVVDTFYEDCVNYLDLWKTNFEAVRCFDWILLKQKLEWISIQNSAEIINKQVNLRIINIDDLFDEVTEFNAVLEKSSFPEQMLPIQKWISIFNSLKFNNLRKIVEFVFCLPGTSAAVERVFSLMNNIWRSERGRLDVSTVRALLRIRVNINLECRAFYDKIKCNNVFLKKVVSSKKYDWFKKKSAQPQPSTNICEGSSDSPNDQPSTSQ